MPVVTLNGVQQWLESTKMTLASLDNELAETAQTLVFARLVSIYDTSEWVTDTTTPKLVRAVISMFVAAWEYQRAYGEEEDSTYGRRLERKANDLLDSIIVGETILEEFPDAGVLATEPDFFPNDESNSTEVYDALGRFIAYDDDVKFRMSGHF